MNPHLYLLLALVSAVCVLLSLAKLAKHDDQRRDSGVEVNQDWIRVWLPMVLAVPCIGLLRDSGDRLTAEVALAISGPALAACAVAAGGVLLSVLGKSWKAEAVDCPPLCWAAFGVVLMSLAVAGAAPQFVLLTALGIGLLCISLTCIAGQQQPQQFAGGYLLLAVLLAGSTGWLAGMGGPAGLWLVLIMTVVVLVGVRRRMGLAAALTCGGWTAMWSATAGVGTLGLDGLAGAIDDVRLVLPRVGYRSAVGLEWLAAPGVLLLAYSGFLSGITRWRPHWAGFAAVVLGVASVLVGVVFAL